MQTKAGDIMTRDAVFIRPEDTLEEAARKMKENDCGFLPVGSKDRIEGAITDRDIVVRAVADGGNPAEMTVRDAMTNIACTCSPGDTIAMAAKKMRENEVSRLMVVDNDGRLQGILSFGHILRKLGDEEEVTDVVSCATGRRNPDAGIAGTAV